MSKPVPDLVEDVLGRHVGIGDTIAYAVTAGRSGDLVIGKVLGFQWSKPQDYVDQELKIRIAEVCRSTGGRWGDPEKPVLIHASMKRFVLLERAA